MEQKKEKNLSLLDLDEFTRNEEDLLAFSSKYKTSSFKEDDIKENEIELMDIRKRLSCDSTSISYSQEYSSMSGCNLKKMKTLSGEDIGFEEASKLYMDFKEKQRKMSSPLCCYFSGSDIYLSKNHKNIVDLNNSQNFIKKENFFKNNSDKEINNINNKKCNCTQSNSKGSDNAKKNATFKKSRKNKNRTVLLNNNNNNLNNISNNIANQNNKNQKKLSLNINKAAYNKINDLNRIQNNNFNFTNNNIYFNNNNYQQIYNINYINLNNYTNNPMNNNNSKRKLSHNLEEGIIAEYFKNILNQINNNSNNKNPNEIIFNIPQSQQNLNPILFSYNEAKEKNYIQFPKNFNNKPIINNAKNDKKPFDKRKGDWLCPECHNLNFAFRIVCNRCQLPKPNNLLI